MTKDEALDKALEGAANYIDALGGDSRKYRQALANAALDKMADNARELGLDYETVDGTHVSKVWWDGDKLMGKRIPFVEFYKPVQQEPSCKDCRTESPCRAKGQDLDVCSVYVPPPAAQQEPDAYGYAKLLAVAIWEQHYKDVAPQWEPFDDLMGVLTQIDNMTAGLTSHRQPLTDEQIDAAVKAWFENDISSGRQPFGKRMRAAIEAAHVIKENT